MVHLLVLSQTLKSKIMKTRLLFFLMTFSIANAQFNVSEGFESGTIPSGWTTDLIDGVVTHSSSCGGTKSARANYYTNAYAIIYTSSYLSNGQAINISYMARKQVGAFFGYQYLYYEVNGSGTWNQIANVYSDFSTCTPINATIAAGVIPSGSTVKFRMQVNRASASNNNYVYFDNFTAVQQVPLVPQAIAEYSFNNTYNNLLDSAPFASNSGTSFTTDRHGNTTGAININNTGTTATITGLPYGANSRSISVWVKNNLFQPYASMISHYGTQYQGFELLYTSSQTTLFASNVSTIANTTCVNGTWYHYVCTYDGTVLKIFKNGALISTSAAVTLTSVNNSDIFTLGLYSDGSAGSFNGAIDDLKIYNYALTQTEITNLNTSNMLASENFNTNNLEVGLYPNPVNDILNIDTNEEILSVEVFALQGQKVMTSKQNKINVAELPAGIYLVRIEDVNNNIATKKIIKN
jgi:hypothetical protein